MAGMVCNSRRFSGGSNRTSALEPEVTWGALRPRSSRSARSLKDKLLITKHLTKSVAHHPHIRHADFVRPRSFYVNTRQGDLFAVRRCLALIGHHPKGVARNIHKERPDTALRNAFIQSKRYLFGTPPRNRHQNAPPVCSTG